MKRHKYQGLIPVACSVLELALPLSVAAAAPPRLPAKQMFRPQVMPNFSQPGPGPGLFHSGHRFPGIGNLPFPNTGQPIAQAFGLLRNAQLLGQARFLASPARFYGGFGGPGFGAFGYPGYGSYGMMPYGGYGGGQAMNYGSAGISPYQAPQALYNNPYEAAPAPTTKAPAAKAGPLAGLLNAQGNLEWPLALRILPPALQVQSLRQQIESNAVEVNRQATAGQVNATLVEQMNRDVAVLNDLLADKAVSLPISQQGVAEGRQFLQRMHDALKTVNTAGGPKTPY